MIHYCAFIHSLMKNNKCESLVNRFKLKDNTSLRKPYQTVLFDSKYQQYSLTCVGTKLLNKFIYSQLEFSKEAFSNHVLNQHIDIFINCKNFFFSDNDLDKIFKIP